MLSRGSAQQLSVSNLSGTYVFPRLHFHNLPGLGSWDEDDLSTTHGKELAPHLDMRSPWPRYHSLAATGVEYLLSPGHKLLRYRGTVACVVARLANTSGPRNLEPPLPLGRTRAGEYYKYVHVVCTLSGPSAGAASSSKQEPAGAGAAA